MKALKEKISLHSILEFLVNKPITSTNKQSNHIYDNLLTIFRKIANKYNTEFYIDDSVFYYKILYFVISLNDNNNKIILDEIRNEIKNIKHNNELTPYINTANDNPTLKYKIKNKQEYDYIKTKL